MKISFTKQMQVAQKIERKAKRRFKARRTTVLVRVQKKWHAPLKSIAEKRGKTISKLHDEIYPHYLSGEYSEIMKNVNQNNRRHEQNYKNNKLRGGGLIKNGLLCSGLCYHCDRDCPRI